MGIPISYFGHTIVGKRDNNEDNYCLIPVGPKYLILAVADGMGGMAAGETASSLAIDTLINVIDDHENPGESLDCKNSFKSAYAKIQDEISAAVELDPSLTGMGTTLTSAIVFEQNKIVWANIGDSRLYLLNKGVLKLLTRDHSYVQEFREKNGGKIPLQILRNYSNLLTRSLDGKADTPDIYPEESDFLKLKRGTILLICSDGLILNSENEEKLFKQIILSNKSLEGAAKMLTDNALKRGTKDNVTVVLYEYGKHRRYSKGQLLLSSFYKRKDTNNNKGNLKSKHRSARILLKLIVFIIILFISLFGGYLIFNHSASSIQKKVITGTKDSIKVQPAENTKAVPEKK